jgi:hypothetical protein
MNVDFNPSTGPGGILSSHAAPFKFGAFIAKYSSNGTYQWAYPIVTAPASNNDCLGTGIVVGSDGYITATGRFSGSGARVNPKDSTVLLDDGNGSYLLSWYNDTCVWNGNTWENCVPDNGGEITRIEGFMSPLSSFTTGNLEISDGAYLNMGSDQVATVYGDVINNGFGALTNDGT